jgi:serine protease Do
LGLVGGVAAVVASSRAFDWPLATKVAEQTSVPVIVNEAPLTRETTITTSFAAAVKKAAPSVVNISTTKTVRQPQMYWFFDDPMFRRFFGDRFGEGPSRPRARKESSLGSGVIVSADGYILSNDHVVAGADEIKVTLANDKQEYPAKVIGHDPKTDVALLKIEAKNLPAITLGDSDKLQVGDVVLAIGSPFGLAQSVTMGIVSGTGRSNMGIEDYEDFIQTDAAINPGNSGGALVDAQGRLIGINTAIVSRTGGNLGVGFAVPINLARNIMDRLLKHGRVDRGFLGVRIQDLTPALAQEFNAPDERGALIGEVEENSAAAEAGLRSGDVIIEFNGKPVQDSTQLRLMVSQTAPGTTGSVKILRQGKERTFKVTLKAMLDQEASTSKGGPAEASEDALTGVTVTDLDSPARRQFNVPTGVRGALVTEVEEDSVAYEAGLRPGDVIQEINRRPITNAEEAVAACKGLKDKRILLRVFSRIGSRYLVVDESKRK